MLSADNCLPALQVPFNDQFDLQKIPVEFQAWWTQFGHVHAMAQLPVGQEISGTMSFDVRIIRHDNPSRLQSVQVWDGANKLAQVNVGENFPADGTFTRNVHVTLDTNDMPDGWRELSLKAVLKSPEGKRYATGSAVPVYVNNNDMPDQNEPMVTTKGINGNGFYGDVLGGPNFGYATAMWREIPTDKVSGQLNLRVKGVNEGDERLVVTLDKDHGTPGAGPWGEVPATVGETLLDTTTSVETWNWIRIDTTQLENGWHQLAARADNDDADAGGNSNSGVAKFWFYVEN